LSHIHKFHCQASAANSSRIKKEKKKSSDVLRRRTFNSNTKLREKERDFQDRKGDYFLRTRSGKTRGKQTGGRTGVITKPTKSLFPRKNPGVKIHIAGTL